MVKANKTPLTRSKITNVKARQVLDSRGNPTVEAEVWTDGGCMGRAIVPSGASTGKHEALELRDGDKGVFNGMGVQKAVSNVNNVIANRIVGMSCTEQLKIDHIMVNLDGTPEKRVLGANAILAVSMATAKAAAAASQKSLYAYLSDKEQVKLPIPMMNIINGGKHAGNGLSIQEFLIEPVGAKSYSEALRFGTEIYHTLKSILKRRYGESSTNVGDEGGYAPAISNNHEALDAIVDAISEAGFSENQIKIGIDAAASSFYDERRQRYKVDGNDMSSDELADYYVNLVDTYPILTIEDPFYEEAFSDFSELTRRIGKRIMIIGDDLFVTNPDRIQRGIKQGAANAVLIKLNQIGTLTETLQAIRIAQEAGFSHVVSHRSGETDDNFIAHLATATESPFIKTGAPARGERVAKYNELLRIEEELGSNAQLNSYRQAILTAH
jgi:enolase